jgi:biotin carboxyl carrier protein
MSPAERPAIRYFVTLAGVEHQIELQKTAAGLKISLDGEPVDADLVRIAEPSLYSLLLDRQSREMVLARDGDSISVSLDGERLVARVQDEVSRALAEFGGSAPSGALEVRAPMPGVVVSVEVKAGEKVEVGQPVVVVEAMKMQNELTAESAGLVERVAVQPGDTVDGDAVLVVLKPLEGEAP